MNDALKSLETLCAERGMRMTEQRRVIARILEESDDHPDVEELYRRSSKIDAKISISTVYRTVKLFEDAGIIERHDFRDGRSRYETVPEEHHDHLIDLKTGTVVEFHSPKSKRCRSALPASTASALSVTASNSTAFHCRRTRNKPMSAMPVRPA